MFPPPGSCRALAVYEAGPSFRGCPMGKETLRRGGEHERPLVVTLWSGYNTSCDVAPSLASDRHRGVTPMPEPDNLQWRSDLGWDPYSPADPADPKDGLVVH